VHVARAVARGSAAESVVGRTAIPPHPSAPPAPASRAAARLQRHPYWIPAGEAKYTGGFGVIVTCQGSPEGNVVHIRRVHPREQVRQNAFGGRGFWRAADELVCGEFIGALAVLQVAYRAHLQQ
jgi:hypothetical protein